MPRTPLTLAALATSAIPGLEVAGTQPFTGGGDGDFDAVLLSERSGEHLVFRAPTSPRAARMLDDEVAALTALTSGARSRLPFAVASVRGTTALPKGRGTGVATTYLPGFRVLLAGVHAGGSLATSIGESIAAIHSLPTSIVADAGLPIETAIDCLQGVSGLVDRAAATGRVPDELVNRWESAVADTGIWQFVPGVIHGSMTAAALLTSQRGAFDEEVVGVLAWSGLRVGDPARDLAWTLALPGEQAAEAVLAAYRHFRRGTVDRGMQHRATLYAELDLARWLLFGVDSGQQDVVEDASRMLESLRRSVAERTAASLQEDTVPVLGVDEVRQLLADQRGLVGADAQSSGVLEPMTPDQSSRSWLSE